MLLREAVHIGFAAQGGNAREATVAKMREEVEAHALYEKSAALARASGIRRIPKLRPSPSSPSGWALAAQSSLTPNTLINAVSNAVTTTGTASMPAQPQNSSGAADAGSATLHAENDMDVSMREQTLLATRVGMMQEQQQQQQQQQQSCSLGREAQLLFGLHSQPTNAVPSHQQHIGPVLEAKTATPDLGEAVVIEERYHRAGREVLGQHLDPVADAIAAEDRAKSRQKAVSKQLGYASLKHVNAARNFKCSLCQLTRFAPQRFTYASAI